MDLGTTNVLGQPGTMGEWNHPILPTLPDGHRPLDRTQVEAPGASEREVVVAPTCNATGHGTAEGLSEHVGEFPGETTLVHVRNQRSKRLGQIRTAHVSQLCGPFL